MIINNSLGARVFNFINYTVISILTLSCVYPLWYTLCVSLSDNSAVTAGLVTLYPINFTLNSYRHIMGDLLFLNSFMISVIRTVLGTLFTLFTIILMAYPLSKSKKEYTHRNKFMWLIIFFMLFSGGIVPWYITMLRYKLIDNIFGLILAGGLPIFSMLLMMNYFRNLPKDMEESAIIDGANPWIILFRVIVPVSVPVIATVALFSGVGYWNEWFQGLLLSSGQEHYPLQTYIQQLVVPVPQSVTNTETLMRLAKLSNRALDAAKVFIAMIPLLCVYPFLQRYFITGITLGSVKE